jgi:hypothetical protein
VRLVYGSLDLTDYPYLIEFGMDTGAPQNVYETMAFLLQDGAVELSSRADNRTLTFTVIIEGPDLAALADAEAALIAETEKPFNTLTIDPGDYGPASVYEVFRGQVALARDDSGEVARLRRYVVTVRALPFVRSEEEVVSEALPASGTTTTLVDNGSATTDWAGAVNGVATAVAVTSGAVGITTAAKTDFTTIDLTRTASINTAATKFLRVDWKPSSFEFPLNAWGDGAPLPKVGETASPTAGFVRSWFYVAAASISVLNFQSASPQAIPPVGASARSLLIDNISRTDIRPLIGTARQQSLLVDVAGSAAAPGSLEVSSATAALGEALVYVYPDDDSTQAYSPACRQFRISGNTVTSDAGTVSGSTEPLSGGTPVIFEMPANLLPWGNYVLCGRLATAPGGGTPTISWSSTAVIGSDAISPAGTNSTTITTTSAYTFYAIGRLVLPPVDIDRNSIARIQLAVWASSTCTYDELYLFNESIGQLVIADCGTGTGDGSEGSGNRRLFIDSPNVVTPRPTVKVGRLADRSDAHHPSVVKSWQTPIFKPPRVRVHWVTPNATDSDVVLRGYPHWHTNAAS